MNSPLITFQLQLDRIQKLLKPTPSHAQGPKKPSLTQQEGGLKP